MVNNYRFMRGVCCAEQSWLGLMRVERLLYGYHRRIWVGIRLLEKW